MLPTGTKLSWSLTKERLPKKRKVFQLAALTAPGSFSMEDLHKNYSPLLWLFSFATITVAKHIIRTHNASSSQWSRAEWWIDCKRVRKWKLNSTTHTGSNLFQKVGCPWATVISLNFVLKSNSFKRCMCAKHVICRQNPAANAFYKKRQFKNVSRIHSLRSKLEKKY